LKNETNSLVPVAERVLEQPFGNGSYAHIYLIFGDMLNALYVVKEVG
jgi:hypothetical protein